jgi:hypothetical protein
MAHKIKGMLPTRKYEFTFEYYLNYHPHLKADVYFFDIWDEADTSVDIHKFSFLLRVMENGTDLKVSDLFAGSYKGKGISIAIILRAKELFNKRIISSSNRTQSYIGEANWKEAIEKVWNPMVSQGLARYDAENDYYYVL